MTRMRAKYVCIQVATGRGVAERYRRQYPAGDTTKPLGKDSEDVYQRLLALGDNPPIDKVAEIIGNQAWSYTLTAKVRDLKRGNETGRAVDQKLASEAIAKTAGQIQVLGDLLARVSISHINRRPRP